MRKRNKKEPALTSLLLIGSAGSLLTVFLSAFLLALISSFSKDPTALTGALSLIAFMLGGFISAFIISRLIGNGGVLIGILSSVIASSTLLIAGLIISGGSCALCVLVNSLAFIGVSSLAAVLAKKIGKKSPKRRYTYG